MNLVHIKYFDTENLNKEIFEKTTTSYPNYYEDEIIYLEIDDTDIKFEISDIECKESKNETEVRIFLERKPWRTFRL